MRARQVALLAALGGAGGLLVVGLLVPRETLAACVASLLGLAGLPLGALALGLALAPVGGGVRDQLWPQTLVASRGLPALLAMALPVLLGAGALYEWVGTPADGFRGAWLSWPAFALRGVFYVGLWWALAHLALPISRRRPEVAGLGLIVLVLSVSLAAFDWAQSLDPRFASSIFGLLWLARLLLSGIAFCTLLALAAGAGRPGVLRGLLAAATLAWLYLHFMQYLIVWYGNLPDEVRWYEVRGGDWPLLTWLLGAQGLIFVALCWPFSQRHGPLAALAIATLLFGLAEGAWLSVPSVVGLAPLPTMLALLAAWVSGGGLIAWLVAGQTAGRRP